MANLEEKFRSAIEKIRAMSASEFEQALISQGYRPVKKAEYSNKSLVWDAATHLDKPCNIRTRNVLTGVDRINFSVQAGRVNDPLFEIAA